MCKNALDRIRHFEITFSQLFIYINRVIAYLKKIYTEE